tara:strand:- start:10261 stop:10671 length:411 start_codon:yes stop_codon:yes gene_type:complete
VLLFPPESVGVGIGFNASGGEIDTKGFSWMRVTYVAGANKFGGDSVAVLRTSPTQGGTFTTHPGTVMTIPAGSSTPITAIVNLEQLDRWVKLRGTGGDSGTATVLAAYGELFGPGSTENYIDRSVGGPDEFEFVVL